MSTARGQFSSKVGFVMAATGSAVGLGNIWGFPTQTASNGGAAFVVVYFLLALVLAYPALMAELILGRHGRSNMATALAGLSSRPLGKKLGAGVGFYGVMVASLILSFYTVVAGWMLAFFADAVATLFGLSESGGWLTTQSRGRNLFFGAIFASLTMLIIARGVEQGIEKWSTRLMPLLAGLLLCLILYVITQPGALEGLRKYLLPDMRQASDPKLIISALGQVFFSLSLGVGSMFIYGSYLSREESLPRMGAVVTLVDVGIAFTAGLLIMPAIYVAQNYGVQIYAQDGTLIAGPDLIFQVLPTLFDSMGLIGRLVGLVFFALMSIAAVTSSISMLEVPVSTAVEKTGTTRARATLLIGSGIFALTSLIIFNFDTLFGLVIDVSTKYSEPLLAVALCIYVGWVLRRDQLLQEVRQGHADIESSVFWKIWPLYVRFFCPLLILVIFFHGVLG